MRHQSSSIAKVMFQFAEPTLHSGYKSCPSRSGESVYVCRTPLIATLFGTGAIYPTVRFSHSPHNDMLRFTTKTHFLPQNEDVGTKLIKAERSMPIVTILWVFVELSFAPGLSPCPAG
jgi:hypothetical protein